MVFTLGHSCHAGGRKQKISHQLFLFLHQQLYIAALSSLSLEIGCKPPIYTKDPYNGIFLLARSVRVVRLVNHCFTTRTSHTSRGVVYTPKVSLMIYTSQTVRLINHCFTARSIRTSPTGPETMVYESCS